jgi:hypothetical protein
MQSRVVNNSYFSGLADGKAAAAKEVAQLKAEINQLNATLAEAQTKLKASAANIKPKVVPVPKPVTVLKPIQLDVTTLKDIPIRCKDCKCEFVHTVADQLKFASRGLTKKPKRCYECRKARREGGSYIAPCPLQ